MGRLPSGAREAGLLRRDAKRRYDDALATALVAAKDAGADDVEVSYGGGEIGFTRFARSRFTQVGAVTTDVLRVRALVGRRLGAQQCGSLAPDQVAAAARGAVAAARGAPALDVDFRFGTAEVQTCGEPSTPPVPGAYDAANAPTTLKRAFDVAREQDTHCAGALKLVQRIRAVRTLNGLVCDGADAWIDLQIIAADGDASGFAGRTCRFDEDLDAVELARAAADKAARGRGAARVDAAPMDVVLAPAAVAELVEWTSMASFGAQSVLDGQSLLSGRIGQTLCDPRISIVERTDEHELTFDSEGTPRQAVAFFDAGVAGQPVTDLLTAARLGDDRGSTGHAPGTDDQFSYSPGASHLHVAAGDRTEAELIADIERGLYVTRLHYVNGMLDPSRAVTTGMTRDGAFLIENGAVGGGVRNLRFTDSMLECWGPRLGGLGSELLDVPTWWTPAGLVTCPAMLIRGFKFTGQSR